MFPVLYKTLIHCTLHVYSPKSLTSQFKTSKKWLSLSIFKSKIIIVFVNIWLCPQHANAVHRMLTFLRLINIYANMRVCACVCVCSMLMALPLIHSTLLWFIYFFQAWSHQLARVTIDHILWMDPVSAPIVAEVTNFYTWLMGFPGVWTQVSGTHGKHCTDWTISRSGTLLSLLELEPCC